QPAKDHCWLASAPSTQGPSMNRATAAGPILHLPLPRLRLVAVGNVIVGPAPQINLLGLEGEKKNEGLISPNPKALSASGNSDGRLMIGMMVRVMRFQSAFSLIGITGWTLRIQTISSLLPAPTLKLFWKGTLMRSATGFWVFLASSVALSVAAKVGSALSVSTRYRAAILPMVFILMVRPFVCSVLVRRFGF